ncbi:MAG: formate dehydrogenase accessory sulfurtransferase FdhD [Dehalococcoidia bacterium]|nr:MAG: formate dehydrogenase accessory sulfurtransferase FdhD [Dehalococcoidia bacterium]
MEYSPDGTELTESCSAIRYEKGCETKLEKPTAREYPLTIIFNGCQLVTMLCSPDSLQDLAVGFLSSEGFLLSKEDIKSITVDKIRGVVRVQTTDNREITPDVLSQRLISSGCGRGAAFYSITDVQNSVVTSKATVSVDEVLALALAFQHASPVYQETHGVHSAALCRGSQILVHAEDIGRHNAVDKVFGRCLLQGISTDDSLLITSGRVSSEIAHKAVKKGIPILISISAPTTMAVQIADKMGITLVSSVRGGKMEVYTHNWRISHQGINTRFGSCNAFCQRK